MFKSKCKKWNILSNDIQLITLKNGYFIFQDVKVTQNICE